jgi:hypothetical protein
MFEVIIHFHMQDTRRVITDDPGSVLYGLPMRHVSSIEVLSLEPVT